MLIRVKKAVYLRDYQLRVSFSNGKTKIIDFEKWIFDNPKSPYLGPMKNIEVFKQFSIDEFGYTLCWPSGADFSPDVLYSVGREVRKTARRSSQKRSIKK